MNYRTVKCNHSVTQQKEPGRQAGQPVPDTRRQSSQLQQPKQNTNITKLQSTKRPNHSAQCKHTS